MDWILGVLSDNEFFTASRLDGTGELIYRYTSPMKTRANWGLDSWLLRGVEGLGIAEIRRAIGTASWVERSFHLSY